MADRTPNILIVEPEPLSGADLATRLQILGYAVCPLATTGEEALELVHREKPDLVLMDTVLRGKMDGIDAAEQIQTQAGVPVVLITDYTDGRSLLRLKQSLAYGVVHKPYRSGHLRIAVEMALYYAQVNEERWRMENALRESETRYRRLIDNIPDVILSVDAGGKISAIHLPDQDLYGYTAREIVGQPFDCLLHPDDAFKVTQAFQKTIRTRQAWTRNMEFRVVGKTGSSHWLELNSHARFDEIGHFQGSEGVLRDISTRKNIETERLRLIEELQQALAEVKTLQTLIPVCAWCKKVRDDKGFWQRFEKYFADRSLAEFSHGICPECSAKLKAMQTSGRNPDMNNEDTQPGIPPDQET